MPVVVIKDEFADFVIDGVVVAGPVSTRNNASGRGRPRWYEATLYRKAGGGYALHQVSLSVVWHLDEHADSHVRKPGEARRSELPGDAVYCGSLRPRPDRDQCPRDDGRGYGTVTTEMPEHKVISYPDATAVVTGVLTARRGELVSVALSEPMRELLLEAEENDPAFRGIRPVMRMLCRLLQTATQDQESRWRMRHWRTGSGRAPGCPARHRTRKTITRPAAGETCGSG
jgi:hypothetical protein